MKKTKRHQTNLISSIIVIATVAALVFLFICLFRQASLEARFDAVIKWLSRLPAADSDKRFVRYFGYGFPAAVCVDNKHGFQPVFVLR